MEHVWLLVLLTRIEQEIVLSRLGHAVMEQNPEHLIGGPRGKGQWQCHHASAEEYQNGITNKDLANQRPLVTCFKICRASSFQGQRRAYFGQQAHLPACDKIRIETQRLLTHLAQGPGPLGSASANLDLALKSVLCKQSKTSCSTTQHCISV